MRILITQRIEQDALRELQQRHLVKTVMAAKRPDLLAALRTCEVLIFRSQLRVDAELISAAPHLELLIRAGLGCENVDMTAARARRLTLLHVPIPRSAAILRAIEQFLDDRASETRAVALHAGLDRNAEDYSPSGIRRPRERLIGGISVSRGARQNIGPNASLEMPAAAGPDRIKLRLETKPQ